MNTATARKPRTAHRAPTGQVTAGRVVASELIKLRTTRSIIWAAATGALLIIGVGAFGAVGLVVTDATAPGTPTADPLGGALAGVSAAVYAIAALGVLAVTGEYATGTIKPTLAAVPRRAQLVLGKAGAVATTAVAIMLTAVFATFLTAQAIVATAGISVTLSAPGVTRALVGAVLYLTGIALLGAAFGWLLRSTAGALATLVGVLVLPPVIGLFLPERVGAAVLRYLPDNAGTAVMQLTPGDQLPPWAGLAVFYGYVAVALTVAVLVVRRRDA